MPNFNVDFWFDNQRSRASIAKSLWVDCTQVVGYLWNKVLGFPHTTTGHLAATLFIHKQTAVLQRLYYFFTPYLCPYKFNQSPLSFTNFSPLYTEPITKTTIYIKGLRRITS